MNTPGTFIVFEGGEGGGKSTQARLLAAALEQIGHRVLVTREPGGSQRAERIRDLILADISQAGDQPMTPRTEALLFAAARADHVATSIAPALATGAVVISDRYIDSSVAYQGVGRALGAQVIEELSLWAVQDLLPDLTLVLDVDPEVGLARAQDPNRMEREPLEFHQGVRATFLELAAQSPHRYQVISADQEPSVIERQVLATVTKELAL